MLFTSLLLLFFFVLAEEKKRYVLEEMTNECREGYVPLTDPHCESVAATFGLILDVAKGVEVDPESNHCTGYTKKGEVKYREIQYWICEDSTVPEHRPLGLIEPGPKGQDKCPEGNFQKITNIEVCHRAADEEGVKLKFDATFGLKSGKLICNIRHAYAEDVIVRFSSDYGSEAELLCESPGTVAEVNKRYVLEEMANDCREGYVPLTDPHCESAAATFGLMGVEAVEVDEETDQCTGYSIKGQEIENRFPKHYWICEDSTVPLHRPLGLIKQGPIGQDECPEGNFKEITDLEVCRRAAVASGLNFDAFFGIKSGDLICNVRYAYEDNIIVRFSSDHGRKAKWLCENPDTADVGIKLN